MALGMGFWGHKDYQGGTNDCWGDTEDESKRTDPNWLYDPVGWRLPGVLAAVGAVLFMYLLARRLFNSEAAGLASAFLLSVDGLVFAQSRIGTPDTFVLFFLLGTLYFLVTDRWLLAGAFLGAAAATKWNAAFAVVPVFLYFAWRFYTLWRATTPDRRLRSAETVLSVGGIGIVAGALVSAALYLALDGFSATVLWAGGGLVALGSFVILGGVVAVVTDADLRNLPRARIYAQAVISLPLFFIAVPFAVYMATYVPMFLNGHGLDHWWDLNRSAYEFHSGLGSPHPYDSKWYEWPVIGRPIFLYLGSGYAKIYSMGNPIVFWMAIPALMFVAWQALKLVRLRAERGGRVAIWGRVTNAQAPLLFVLAGYLTFWLPWAAAPRVLFLYHYIPSLAFGVLALGYTVHWLWHSGQQWSRGVAVAFLAAAGVTFIYFYPHLAAVDVPRWLDETYYWFDGWR
jgi:dolichyl-phosphate-mannose--protein O-mannosyl transferase